MLDHADVQAAQDVDEGDDDARDGVAADEFAGTVHGPVEIGLLRRSISRRSRACGLVDVAGVQVGVDRHLLAGHRPGVEDLEHPLGGLAASSPDARM